MLVFRRLRGHWNGKKFIFNPSQELVIFKGKLAQAKGSTTTAETVPTGPWQPQVPYINNLFSQAAGLYNQGPPQAYPGSTVAPITPQLQATNTAALGQIGGNIPTNNAIAGTAANTALNAGNNPLAQIGAATQPGTIGAVGNLLTGQNPISQNFGGLLPGVSGAINNVIGQGTGTPTTGAPQIGAGNIDLTGNLNQSLQGGALSPYLDQIIQGALRQSNQNYTQNVIPGIGDQASAAGQVGGTRQGIAQGLAAQEQVAGQNDIITRLNQAAFDQGAAERQQALGLVSGAQTQNASNQLQQQQLNSQIQNQTVGQILAGSQLGGNLALGGQQLGQSGQIAGVNAGTGAASGGYNAMLDALTRGANTSIGAQGANLQQLGFANDLGLQQYGFNQAQIDDAVNRYYFNMFSPYNALSQYQNYVSGPWGSSIAGQPNTPTPQNTGGVPPNLPLTNPIRPPMNTQPVGQQPTGVSPGLPWWAQNQQIKMQPQLQPQANYTTG